MVLAMYRVHSSMCMQGQMKEEYGSSPIAYQPNHYQRVKVEVEDVEIESTLLNLNPRVDTVVYHHHHYSSYIYLYLGPS